jgi:hypothetical protein
VLAIDCAIGENEQLMRRDMMNDMAEMLEASGVKDVTVYDNGYFPGMGIHEMGTARMGRDPKTSVLNANNQVWDVGRVHHGRIVHDVGGLPEPVADLHGADGPRRGVRGRRVEARQPVNAERFMDQIPQATLTRREVLQMVTALLGGAALAGGERVLAFSFDDAAIAVAAEQGTSLFAAADVAVLDEIAETSARASTLARGEPARSADVDRGVRRAPAAGVSPGPVRWRATARGVAFMQVRRRSGIVGSPRSRRSGDGRAARTTPPPHTHGTRQPAHISG